MKAVDMFAFPILVQFIAYSKFPTYEQVPFGERFRKSSLYISPTKLA